MYGCRFSSAPRLCQSRKSGASMAKTSGGVPPAIRVFSFVQYESQSETSTFTVMDGLAEWKSSTTACQTASSSGAPHIMKVTSVALSAAGAPPHAASSMLATTMTKSSFFIFFSFCFDLTGRFHSVARPGRPYSAQTIEVVPLNN